MNLSRTPIPITFPHYFDFGEDREVVGEELTSAEAWDALRTETTGAFGLPANEQEWRAFADRIPEHELLAAAINDFLDELNATSVASYGVGAAPLECWIQRGRPERRLLLTEFGPETVTRLRAVAGDAEVHKHDLLADPPLDADVHLFHRVDAEFSSGQWRGILERFADARILAVTTDNVSWEMLKICFRRWRSGGTRAGRFRNRAALERIWRRGSHTVHGPRQLHDVPAWLLEPAR